MYYTTRVYNALPVRGLPCITCQGFVMHYTWRVCHPLHVKGLSYITRQGVAMHYTSRVCYPLHVKGLSCITRKRFVMNYTTKVYRTLLTNKFSTVQTVHWTLLGCVETLTALGRRWSWCCRLRWLRLHGVEAARRTQIVGHFQDVLHDFTAPLVAKLWPPPPPIPPAILATASYLPDELARRGPTVNSSASHQPGFRVQGVFRCWTL